MAVSMSKRKLFLLSCILILSMVFVIYPSVDALIQAQNAIETLNAFYYWSNGVGVEYNDSLDYPRNLVVLQIGGLVLLYLFLGVLLYSNRSQLNKPVTENFKQEVKSSPDWVEEALKQHQPFK